MFFESKKYLNLHFRCTRQCYRCQATLFCKMRMEQLFIISGQLISAGIWARDSSKWHIPRLLVPSHIRHIVRMNPLHHGEKLWKFWQIYEASGKIIWVRWTHTDQGHTCLGLYTIHESCIYNTANEFNNEPSLLMHPEMANLIAFSPPSLFMFT